MFAWPWPLHVHRNSHLPGLLYYARSNKHVVGKMGIFESIYTLHTVNPEILVVHDLNLAI